MPSRTDVSAESSRTLLLSFCQSSQLGSLLWPLIHLINTHMKSDIITDWLFFFKTGKRPQDSPPRAVTTYIAISGAKCKCFHQHHFGKRRMKPTTKHLQPFATIKQIRRRKLQQGLGSSLLRFDGWGILPGVIPVSYRPTFVTETPPETALRCRFYLRAVRVRLVNYGVLLNHLENERPHILPRLPPNKQCVVRLTRIRTDASYPHLANGTRRFAWPCLFKVNTLANYTSLHSGCF